MTAATPLRGTVRLRLHCVPSQNHLRFATVGQGPPISCFADISYSPSPATGSTLSSPRARRTRPTHLPYHPSPTTKEVSIPVGSGTGCRKLPPSSVTGAMYWPPPPPVHCPRHRRRGQFPTPRARSRRYGSCLVVWDGG